MVLSVPSLFTNGCYAFIIDSTVFYFLKFNTSSLFRRKKIENIGKMTQMTQDEIVTNTKTVLQGLEALRLEHMSIMAGLSEDKKDPDKSDIISKNITNIELGLGEANVSTNWETFELILRLFAFFVGHCCVGFSFTKY